MRPRSRFYRFLLLLLPPRLRRARSEEMELLVADMMRERRDTHGLLGPGFWIPLVWDTCREAARAWMVALVHPVRLARPPEDLVSAFVSDVRFGLRQIVRRPAYSLTLLALMSIGIAGNAAVFRIFNGLFLRPLPFEHPEQLVDLDERAPAWNLEYTGIAFWDFSVWDRENRSFASMAVYTVGGRNLTGGETAERVDVLASTHDLDDVLGLEPILGRFYDEAEDIPDGPHVVVLSESYWSERYGRDVDVLGRTVSLSGTPYEIIGVLPAQADFVSEADLWTPLQEDASDQDGWYLTGVGRLQDGVSPEAAERELAEIHRRVIPERDTNAITSPVVSGLKARYLGRFRAGGGFLLAAVFSVLLIACANIAGLMFARSLARASELGIRQAMGASRGRIVRQLLAESLVIAAVGGTVGGIVGFFASNALVRATADRFPSWVTFDVDARWTLFLAGLTAAACAVFGVVPALRAPRADLATQGRATSSRGRRRVMSGLVVAELAVAVALLVVGGLTTLDAWELAHTDPGFRTDGVLTYRLALPNERYPDDQARRTFADEYEAKLAAIPGVLGVGLGSAMPLSGHWGWFFQVEGAPPRADGEASPVVLMRSVNAGYFDALGVQLLAGRTFDDRDGREGSEQVVIVNESFVDAYLGGDPDPLGRRIQGGTGTPDPDGWLTIVGVTRDVKHYGVDRPMRPGVYQPLPQVTLSSFVVGLRTGVDPESVLPAVRAATSELDSELPPYAVATMASKMRDSLWARRAVAWLAASFSAVALLLAIAGLYGVISYAVGQRSQEISIRMAMGAGSAQVRGEIVRSGMMIAAVGLAVGTVGALASGSLLSRILVGVPASEPAVYVGVAILLGLVALAANWLPARRAAALDPMRSLRGE